MLQRRNILKRLHGKVHLMRYVYCYHNDSPKSILSNVMLHHWVLQY